LRGWGWTRKKSFFESIFCCIAFHFSIKNLLAFPQKKYANYIHASLFIRGNLQGMVTSTDDGHLVIKPSFTPESAEQEEEWLEILRVVLAMALSKRHMSIITYQPAHQVYSADVSYSLQPECVKCDYLHVTESIMTYDILREVCATPQFFFSALAFTPVVLYSDIESLTGCTENKIPDLTCEYICMNSNGSALYWLNPKNGADFALDMLAKQAPYLQVKTF